MWAQRCEPCTYLVYYRYSTVQGSTEEHTRQTYSVYRRQEDEGKRQGSVGNLWTYEEIPVLVRHSLIDHSHTSGLGRKEPRIPWGFPWNAMEPYGKHWKLPERDGLWQKANEESHGIAWNLTEPSRKVPWELTWPQKEGHGIPWNLVEYSGCVGIYLHNLQPLV